MFYSSIIVSILLVIVLIINKERRIMNFVILGINILLISLIGYYYIEKMIDRMEYLLFSIDESERSSYLINLLDEYNLNHPDDEKIPYRIKDFYEILKDFVQEIKFNRLGVFSYSDEEGTKAFDFLDKVDTEVANKRKDEVMQLQQKISLELNKKLIGNKYLVIIDNYDFSKKMYMGRNYAYAPDDADGYIYIVSNEKLEIGNIYNVEITDADAYELKAKLVN